MDSLLQQVKALLEYADQDITLVDKLPRICREPNPKSAPSRTTQPEASPTRFSSH